MHGSGLCAWASGRTGMALVTEFLCKIGARLWQQGSYQAYMVIGWTTMVRFMKLFRTFLLVPGILRACLHWPISS